MSAGRPVRRRKRSHNEGSIHQTERRGSKYWVAQISLPDGRRKTSYHKTMSEASEALLKTRTAIASGVLPSDLTFKEWSTHWLENKSSVSMRTISQYSRNIQFACDVFGSIQLAKIQAHHIESMLNRSKERNHSTTSSLQIFRTVSSCLKAAFQRGMTARNACEIVQSPRSKKRQPVVLSRVEWKSLIDASRCSERELIVEFALKTGMRIGEVLSASWSDISEQDETIAVRKSKTDAGTGRRIPLDPVLLGRLVALRTHHMERQLQYRGWNSENLVFCTDGGSRNDYQNLQKRILTPLIKGLGIKHLTWHHLRHNAGSYLLSEGVPITAVSKILGHANPAITMGIYAHELKEDFGQVRAAMAKFA